MLAEALKAHPLQDGQRVLALTYYHGGRRRLLERLRSIQNIVGHVECRTVDGFALRTLRRWRGLASTLGIPPVADDQFEVVCDAAGRLLEHPQVREWTAASFPIVLLDEGQDLRPERLRMFVAMANSVQTLIAADEFQCLDPELRPNPLVDWLSHTGQTETLTTVHRTNVAGLLDAATAIRSGQAPQGAKQQFTLFVAPSIPLAATVLANAIAWHGEPSSVAIIAPALAGGWAQAAVERVCKGPCGKQQNGPYDIRWEANDAEETFRIVADLKMDAKAPAETTLAALRALVDSGPVRQTISWVQTQIHVAGRTDFQRIEIANEIARCVTLRRQHGGIATHRYAAMTVHQAKNREFSGVVVLWPYRVRGDAEQKARLLYNAVTRAKRWCTVILQGQDIADAPPFSFPEKDETPDH